MSTQPPPTIDPEPRKHWLARLLPILRRHRALCGVGAVISAFAVLFHSAAPALLGNAIDSIARAVQTGDGSRLDLAVSLFLAAGAARSVFGHFSRVTLYKLSYLIEADLRAALYDHLTRLPFAFYDRAQTGQIVSRANDVRSMQLFLVFTPYVAMIFGSFLLGLGYMLSIDPGLTLLAVAPLPAVFLLSLRLRTVIYPLSWLVQSRLAEVATIVDENINGQQLVKLFAQEERQIGLLQRAAARVRWSVVRMIETRSKYSVWIESLPTLSQVLILLYGGWLVLQGTMEIGQLVAFNVYVVMMQTPFQMLGFLIVLGQKANASARRVFEILDHPVDAAEDRRDLAALDGVRGNLRFEDVVFSYDGDAREQPVLNGLSCTIAPDETVAIVGRIGRGKSSIARLLLRFYEPSGGRILLDGQDIRGIAPQSLRRQIVLAPDEPFLFSTSVRDNIAYGRPDASEEEIVQAARAAQAHDFISALPGGYDTVLGEKGATLSGGQRQRIGLARALLVDPAVLILDEATSAVDIATEEKIYAAVRKLRPDRTNVLIGHRLSVIHQADRVLFLEGGTIAATGTHRELMETVPGYRQALTQPEPAPVKAPVREESDEEYFRRIRASVPAPNINTLQESADV